MPCYTPINAYRTRDGISFHQNTDENLYPIKLPCGQCVGCRMEYARQWAVRCVHEASLHENNCFITLTLNDEHLNQKLSLDKSDFRFFMKRLRQWQYRQNEKHIKNAKDIKLDYTTTNPLKAINAEIEYANKTKEKLYGKLGFYMCGEYGENFSRPHYHACLFNFDFPDKSQIENTKSGHSQYTSKILDELWGMGRCTIGEVTPESAAYVARYVSKKIRGTDANNYYGSRIPEYTACSRRPAIGLKWIEKFHTDIYNHDVLIHKEHKMRPPRYYDKFYEKFYPEKYLDLKCKREESQSIQSLSIENTPERMNVKHKIALIHSKQEHRALETQTINKQDYAPVKSYDNKVIAYNEETL